MCWGRSTSCSRQYTFTHGELQPDPPLYAGQDGSHIVRRAPSVLQDVQAKLARAVHVRVEHLADELDARWLVGISLLKVHHQPERPILKRRVCGSDNDGIPVGCVSLVEEALSRAGCCTMS